MKSARKTDYTKSKVYKQAIALIRRTLKKGEFIYIEKR